MGFVEVLFNLKTILGNIKICKNDIANSNLMSLFLLTILALICVLQNGQEKKHPNTLLHIAPIWAWKENRITDIKKIDKMYVILPFENIL
jgi:lipid-A-disaccharide synthase